MRPVNLLPDNLRPRERSARSGTAYVTLGILAALLVGMVTYVVLENQVTSRKAATERLYTETQEAEARAGELAPFGDFRDLKETRVTSVTALAAVRFDWERASRELARLLPKDVWLSELQATATGEAPSGSSSSSSSASSSSSSSSSSSGAAGAAANQGPSLRLIGCAPSQQAVAETMVRLRRLNQAQDVNLIASEQPKEQASATTGAGTSPGAAGAATEGCGLRNRRPNYKFEVSVTLTPSAASGAGGEVPRSLGGGA